MLEKFILLVFCHFMADLAFQSELVAEKKNPLKSFDRKDTMYVPNWQYFMAGHCSTHAILVYLVTQNIWLGVAEFICHFLIDYAKCLKKIDLHKDQRLHLWCKLAWSLV